MLKLIIKTLLTATLISPAVYVCAVAVDQIHSGYQWGAVVITNSEKGMHQSATK